MLSKVGPGCVKAVDPLLRQPLAAAPGGHRQQVTPGPCAHYADDDKDPRIEMPIEFEQDEDRPCRRAKGGEKVQSENDHHHFDVMRNHARNLAEVPGPRPSMPSMTGWKLVIALTL